MIIGIGIIATDNIKASLIWGLIIIGVILTGVGLYGFIKDIVSTSSHNKLKKNSLAYRAKDSGLEEIHDQLKIMKTTRPGLVDEIDNCLKQIVDMNGIFDRFDQLIKINDANYVSGGRVALQEIEKTLCVNFRWVINSSIAADEDESPSADKFHNQCRERIFKVTEANSLILDKGNEFLLALADNISQAGAKGNTDVLDSWMDTIHEQNKKSTIGR